MKKQRALIVDDHGYIRTLISNILEKLEFDVQEAADGQEAVDIFLKKDDQKYDLITMDYQMPRLNGAEAVHRIRAKNKKVPIICISGALSLMRPELAEYGNMYYLDKPFNLDEFKMLVDQITQ